jgi:hypothetical protein
MPENPDAEQEPSSLDQAVDLLEEVDARLRATPTQDADPASRAEVLSDLDAHVDAPMDSVLDEHDLDALEETLADAESLLETHRDQQGLTDSVRNAATFYRRFTDSNSPEPDEAVSEAISLYRRILEIRRQVTTWNRGLTLKLFSADLDPEDPEQVNIQWWHDRYDCIDENRAGIESALETLETLRAEYDDSERALAAVGIEPLESPTGYLSHDEDRIRTYRVLLTLVSSLVHGTASLLEGHLAFAHEEWTDARRAFETASEEFTGSFQTYRSSRDTVHGFFEEYGQSFTEAQSEQFEAAASETVEAVDGLVEAATRGEAGDTERATTLYREKTDRLVHPFEAATE